LVATTPATAQVCAVVLAGGRGARMQGLDKGLQGFRGTPLALHAVQRLQAQSGGAPGLIALNANRSLAEYARWQLPVWPDHLADFAGPLAGFASALAGAGADYPYVLTVPCDSPLFPLDLLARLMHALHASEAEIAMPLARESTDAADGALRLQPVFCLMRTTLAADLEEYLALGGRKIAHWARRHRLAEVAFDQEHDAPAAFANANTLDELQRLEAP